METQHKRGNRCNRTVGSRGFTRIPNDVIRNAKLSPAARCLLMIVASHTAAFTIRDRQLAANLGLGRDAFKAALSELAKQGYTRSVMVRDARGRVIANQREFTLTPWRWPAVEGDGAVEGSDRKPALPEAGFSGVRLHRRPAAPASGCTGRRLNRTHKKTILPKKTKQREEDCGARDAARAPRARLPRDWTPDVGALAAELGIGVLAIERSLAAFVDHFTDGRGHRETRTPEGWLKRFRLWAQQDAERASGADHLPAWRREKLERAAAMRAAIEGRPPRDELERQRENDQKLRELMDAMIAPLKQAAAAEKHSGQPREDNDVRS